MKMSTYSILEQTLKEIVDGVKPLRDDWGTRFEVINDLRIVVQSVKNLRGDFCFIVVHPFHFPPVFVPLPTLFVFVTLSMKSLNALSILLCIKRWGVCTVRQ